MKEVKCYECSCGKIAKTKSTIDKCEAKHKKEKDATSAKSAIEKKIAEFKLNLRNTATSISEIEQRERERELKELARLKEKYEK